MRFFRPKLPQLHDANQLRQLLIEAIRTQDQRMLADLCKTHQDMILHHFAEWTKVPSDIRSSPKAIQLYVNTLGTVAQFFATQLGNSSLFQQLIVPEETNPLTEWQEALKQAQEYMDGLRYAEAIQALSDLLLKVHGLTGSGVDKYLPITYGYLGESYFQHGEALQAISPMETARRLCEQQGDYEGVGAYEGNLYEIYRYLGQAEAAAQAAERLAQILDKQEQKGEATKYRKQAQQVMLGEPLNRVVVHIDGMQFELSEIHQIDMRNQRVQFVFQRNRISLKPASAFIDQGQKLARKNNFGDALLIFQNAIKADQYDPQAPYLAGLTLLNLQRYKEAAESYEITERLAPGWYNCRADLWLARQLASRNISHEIFIALHKLEDWPLDPKEKTQLAEQSLAKAPNLAPLYLFYGKSLSAIQRTKEAEAAYRKGLTCVEEPDIKTRLLVQLGLIVDSASERKQLLEQAVEVNGNLVAAAMAVVDLAATK